MPRALRDSDSSILSHSNLTTSVVCLDVKYLEKILCGILIAQPDVYEGNLIVFYLFTYLFFTEAA